MMPGSRADNVVVAEGSSKWLFKVKLTVCGNSNGRLH
jgi:hypothetical protein